MSPYLQKLPHSNFIQTILPPSSSSAQQQRRQRRRRRRSTSVTRTRGELLDSAYQTANVDHLDLSSFFGNSNPAFYRPTSAPTRTYVLFEHFINRHAAHIYFLVCLLQQRKNVHEHHFINQVQEVIHFLSQYTVMEIMKKVVIVKLIL
jgi:hypothetical protein